MMPEAPSNDKWLVFVLFIFTLEAILFSAGNFKSNLVFLEEELKSQKVETTLGNLPVVARAVSVYDVEKNKKIYGKNDEVAMPIASLAKTMTITVALGGQDGKKIISISPEAINQAGDFGLFLHEKWRAEDLARFTLVASANDGAYALAEGDLNFLDRVNAKAKKIGMKHSLFLNPTGLDLDIENSGAFASALDANLMAIYGLKSNPDIFSVTIMPEINLESESGFVHNFKNTNIVLGKIPNLVFSKTGFTEVAGGNLTVIFKNKDEHLVAVTVLGSTFERRFSDMEKIVEVLSQFP